MPILQQFDTTLNMLQKVLDLRSKNQQIISSNIANAETPGYSAKSLAFEEQLQSALSKDELRPVQTHPGHIPLSPGSISQVTGIVTVNADNTGIGDENSVSVDQEMVKLSENQILYEAAVSMLNKKLSMIKQSMNSGA